MGRRELIERHLPLVERVSRRFPAHLREDAVQDGVFGLARALDRYDGRGSFETYAWACIAGSMREGIRRMSRRYQVTEMDDGAGVLDMLPHGGAAPGDRVDGDDSVEVALSGLPERWRVMFRERYGEGLTLGEIGDRHGVHLTRVKQILDEAMVKVARNACSHHDGGAAMMVLSGSYRRRRIPCACKGQIKPIGHTHWDDE